VRRYFDLEVKLDPIPVGLVLALQVSSKTTNTVEQSTNNGDSDGSGTQMTTQNKQQWGKQYTH
jgi:hypothetical protein